MITVSRVNQSSIRVNFIPARKKEDENAVLATPLSFSGARSGLSLASYLEALNRKKQEDVLPKESVTETAKTADENTPLFAGQQK